jgi:hypothetical protein
MGPLWHGLGRVHVEPEPVPAVIDPVVEAATEPATVEEQTAASESPDAELPETPSSPAAVVPVIRVEDMTSLDLAVLITARHRTVRQALKAASLLADRHEWYHLEECADMLCRSYEPNELALGLHVLTRYRTANPTMLQKLTLQVRSLTRNADPRIAALAQGLLWDATANGYAR